MSILISVYGAIVSTALATLTIYRHFRDQNFLITSIDVTTDENGNDVFEVWVMNNGSGPVGIRELWVGHGKIKGRLSPARYGLTVWNFLHPRLLEPEAMIMDFGSAYGKDGNIIKIDPGSARKWEFEIKSLQEAYKERILFSKDFNKKYIHDDAKYRFALRIRHTRSKHPIVLALEPRNTELLPGNQMYLPNFTYCDENIKQDF